MPREGLRVLFLHGYGGSPDLIKIPAARFLTGLLETLPRVDIQVPRGFVQLNLDDPVTDAIFSHPANNLSKVAKYSQITGAGLHAWCSPKAAGIWSQVDASADVASQTQTAARGASSPVVDLSDAPENAPAQGVGREDIDEMREVTTKLVKLLQEDPVGYDLYAPSGTERAHDGCRHAATACSEWMEASPPPPSLA